MHTYYQGSWKLRNRFKFVQWPPSNLYPTDLIAAKPTTAETPKEDKEVCSTRLRYGIHVVWWWRIWRERISFTTLMQQEEGPLYCHSDRTMSTCEKRREWIVSDTSSVSDILQKFPSLKHRKVVSSSTINYVVVALLCHAIISLTFLVTSLIQNVWRG